MIFDNTNLETATNAEILEMELEHVATQLISLGMNRRLCSLEGREVIAEYGFTGDFAEVTQALNTYSEMLEDIGVDDNTREEIIERKKTLIAHRVEADSDDKHESEKLATILEAVKSRKPEHVIATLMAQNETSESANIQLRQDALHDAKLCTCFTN